MEGPTHSVHSKQFVPWQGPRWGTGTQLTHQVSAQHCVSRQVCGLEGSWGSCVRHLSLFTNWCLGAWLTPPPRAGHLKPPFFQFPECVETTYWTLPNFTIHKQRVKFLQYCCGHKSKSKLLNEGPKHFKYYTEHDLHSITGSCPINSIYLFWSTLVLHTSFPSQAAIM